MSKMLCLPKMLLKMLAFFPPIPAVMLDRQKILSVACGI